MPEINMADQPVTREKLINADIDVENLGKAVNEFGVVNPRYGESYPTLPSAIQTVIETGGFEPFATEAELKSTTPTLPKKASYALDTHNVWLWENGAWGNAGTSVLNQVKKSADQEFNLFKYNESVGLTAPDFISGGVFTTADASESGRGFFTETFVSGVTYFGWTFPRTTQEKISAEIYVKGNPEIVRLTFYNDVSNIISKQFDLVATHDNVKKYSLSNFTIPSGTTRIRLLCYNSAANARVIEYFKPYIGFGDKLLPTEPIGNEFFRPKTTTFDLLQPANVLPKKLINFEQLPDYSTNSAFNIETLNNLPALRVTPINADEITRAGWTHNLSALGFTNETTISGSIIVKVESGALPLRCYLQRFNGNTSINYVEMTSKLIGNNTYLYSLSDMPIVATMDRVRLMFTGQVDSTYLLSLPTVTRGGVISGVGLDNVMSATSVDSDTEQTEINENTIADVVSRIQLPLINGGLDLINGELIDRYADFNYFSVWGSSTIEAMSSLLRYDLMPLTGATQWFNGSRGGECVSHTSARMGARKLRCTFASAIPDSGSVNLATHNLNQHKLSYLKQNFTGTFEVESGEKIHGTVSYSASSPSGLIFTRTTSGSVISVPNAYEFVPDFDEKFLCGYAVMNVAKNDTDDPNLTGTEGLFLRTLEMYTNLKSTFKRCIILGNFVNKDSSVNEPERQKHVLDLNRRLKEHFGKVYIDVQEYICSAEVWTDINVTPTSEDLAYQAKGELAESLMLNFAHTSAVVNERIVNKLIKNRMIELGWISL